MGVNNIKVNDIELRELLAMADGDAAAIAFKTVWAASRGPILDEFNQLLNSDIPGAKEIVANLMTLRLKNTP